MSDISVRRPSRNRARLSVRIGNVGQRVVRGVYQRVFPAPHGKSLLFIFGCQRSGTSMLNRVLERDLRTHSYGEWGLAGPFRPRLMPYEQVRERIEDDPAWLVVVKPLVESQNARRLLDEFPSARAIWMYRGYEGVAQSDVARFGAENSLKKLRRIIERDGTHWSSEDVDDETRDLVRDLCLAGMTGYAAAALFWYVRNRLYFSQGLDRDPRVLLTKYEALVTAPEEHLERIYRLVGMSPPKHTVAASVHTKSLRKGDGVGIEAPIAAVCGALEKKLDRVLSKGDARLFGGGADADLPSERAK